MGATTVSQAAMNQTAMTNEVQNTPPDDSLLLEQLRMHKIGDWDARQGLLQDFRCVYCDRDLLASYDNYNSWACDHIIPLSRDGDGAEENVVICCRTCNFLKRSYVPNGATRAERIADARRYVQEARLRHEARITAMRTLVRPHALPRE